jgi:hypothetical protein
MRDACKRRSALDFVMAWSESGFVHRSKRKMMSVATSVKRYINGLTPASVKGRTSSSSPPFSPSFVTAGRIWLAANSIWATLVVSTCVTVAMRLRIDKSLPFIAFIILVSAGLVFRELWRGVQGAASNSPPSRVSLKTLLILALGLASSGFLLWPCFTRGAFVSVTGDTFLYSAFGQYLVDHHRGFEYGLSPIDQYATGLSGTRFGTASVLGFFSVLFHSSTAAVLPIYIFIVLANIFSGFVLLSRRFGCNRLFSLAAGLYAVTGGWTPNALNIGGLDNLLFLSFFPFLVVRLELYRFGQKSWSASLGLVLLASSVFYAYPEGLAIAGAMFLPFFCGSLWSGICRRGKTWPRYVISACLVLVLICPYGRVFFGSLFERIGIGMAKGAAGLFPGLFSPRFLPAMFGFSQEYARTISSPHDAVLPIMMLALIVLGSAIWIRRRKSLVLAFLILIMMAIWQGWFHQYDYGLYKILFIGSLIWIPALFRGGTAVANFVPRPTRPFAVTFGAIIFLSGALAQRMEQQEKIPFRQVIPMRYYSDLASLRHKVGSRPVLLVCDDAFAQEYKDFDQEWAVFFLRHVNLKVPEYFGYLGAGGPLMPRAKSTSEPAAFVLVNKRIEDVVWANQRFSLLELPVQAKLVDVQAPNGLQQANGKPFVWLGNNATRFLIVSKIAQTATFSAAECLTGPSRPEYKDRQIRVSIGSDVWQTDVSGALSLQVPLKPGLNFLDISCQNSSTVSEQTNGDTKALPLGLWDYQVSSKEGVTN